MSLLLRLGFGRLQRRRDELAAGRAAIARLAQTVNEASRVLTAPMHADDLEGEVSGHHETLPHEPRQAR